MTITLTGAESVRLSSAGSLFASRPVTDFATVNCETSVGCCAPTVKPDGSGPVAADASGTDPITRATTEVVMAAKRAGAVERDTEPPAVRPGVPGHTCGNEQSPVAHAIPDVAPEKWPG